MRDPTKRDEQVPEQLFNSFSPSFIHSYIHPSHSYLSESPSQELTHETRGKQTIAVRADPRRQKAYIQWCVAWFREGCTIVLRIIFKILDLNSILL